MSACKDIAWPTLTLGFKVSTLQLAPPRRFNGIEVPLANEWLQLTFQIQINIIFLLNPYNPFGCPQFSLKSLPPSSLAP